MSASPLFLSYPCLKSVIKELQIDKRKRLAKLSLQFRKIDNQLDYRVNCLKFVLKKGSDKAMLSIDSVKWVFEKKDGLVVVKCSLDPQKVVELPGDEFRVPWEYFQCFMNSERIQICKLELVGCQDPFRNLTRFNVPFLKWTFDKGDDAFGWSASSLTDYSFKKLELRNAAAPLIFEKDYVKNAEKLIIFHEELKPVPYNNNFHWNTESLFLKNWYRNLQNPILQVTMYMSQFESFIEIIRNLLQNPHEIGSFYKMTYKNAAFTQQFLWELLEKLFDAKKMMVDGNECMSISDPKTHREINTFIFFKNSGFGGCVAVTNTTLKAIIMPENTAVSY